MAAADNLQPQQFSYRKARAISEGYDSPSFKGVGTFKVDSVPTPDEPHDYWNFPAEKHLYVAQEHEDKVFGLMDNLDNVPPVLLNEHGKVMDGYHRAEAHRRANRLVMRAFVPLT